MLHCGPIIEILKTKYMQKLVVFSGAGMSAESGISTFRDSGGLWEQYAIEEVATPQAWQKNPALVQSFYNQRRTQIRACQPNTGHLSIAQLQKHFDTTVVTQNIDDLHERAGCERVVHLHGLITLAKSSGPKQESKYYEVIGDELTPADVCDDGYPLRPHVVWFGEEVPMLQTAAEIIAQADLFLVIGTSLQVYPAAGLIHAAKRAKEKVLIDPNAHELQVDDDFIVINKGAAEGLKIWSEKKAINL